MTSLLSRLLALANQPGTEHEGEAARAAAARTAARDGQELVRRHDGELATMDDLHADLLHALRRIAGDETTRGEIGG